MHGRFSWQTELFTAQVRRQAAEQVGFWGGYVYASWFLTNDARNYDFGTGSFIDVIPNSPLFNAGWVNGWGDGWGALEVAARLSYVDLTDEDIIGGRESNISLGLNWYMNRDVRLMTNLVKVMNVDRPGSKYDNQDPLIFSIRAQWVLR